MNDRWLVPCGGRTDAPVTLFCLPYAGGSAAAFRSWSGLARRLDARVLAVELPGHGRRLGELPAIDESAVADAIAAAVDRPYVLFGHSLGARLAFEVARRLRDRPLGGRLVRLLVSGTPGPRHDRVGRGDSRLPDDLFLARVRLMGGTPATILDDRELRDMFLPVLRADFRWGDDYQYRPDRLLDCPVSAFAGMSDPEAPPTLVEDWRAETTGEFRLHVLDGDHFFLHRRAGELFDLVEGDLSGHVVAWTC